MHVYRNKARNPALKRKILPSLFREEPPEGEEAVPALSKAAKVRSMCCFAKLDSKLYFWTLIKIRTCFWSFSKYARSIRKFQNLKKEAKF